MVSVSHPFDSKNNGNWGTVSARPSSNAESLGKLISDSARCPSDVKDNGKLDSVSVRRLFNAKDKGQLVTALVLRSSDA